MKLKPIITSLLETDMYKFSMGQGIFHQYPSYMTTWTFRCRNNDVKFTPEMVEEIREQIRAYCTLRFTEDELQYLDNIKWIKGSYVNFLRIWQPRFEDFEITTDDEHGLSIEDFSREFSEEETLPWDHISVGVKKSFLLSERHKAHEETTTPSCREHCSGCGVACFGVGECFAKRNVNKEEPSDAAK